VRPPQADVLIADTAGRSGLAVARSLSRRGISFVVLGTAPNGMVAASRHVRRYLEAPPVRDDPEAFLEAVLDAAAAHRVRLVMPMTDAALATCSERRDLLPAEAKLAAASPDAVRHVLDKRRHLETARRLGIPCPPEAAVQSIEQSSEVIDQLGFPMVLKSPGHRPEVDLKWLIATNEDELRAHLARLSEAGVFPILQKLVDGHIANLCCFAARGELIAVHEYRSLRRLAWEGTSVLMEVTEPPRALVEYAERLLAELAWDGAAHLGFVVDPRSGDEWYMETNGRLWASVGGSLRMGWDFPYWTYRYFTAGEVPQPPPPVLGSKTCWRWGSLRLLNKRLRGVEPPMPPRPTKLQAVADYLAGFRPGVHSDVFRLDDPLPELVEHLSGLRQSIGRRLPRRQSA
jgi:predicted ATP-grasp superfamily ATP-dependent carboligase